MSTARAWQAETRMSGTRPLLVERAAVLLRRIWHGMGRAWAQQRGRQAAGRQPMATRGLSALLGRALTGRSAGGRMLAVEERLALGPKQHLYVIRCGEQRLLLASAVEGSLQWMALPEDSAESGNPCDNTQLERGGTGATGNRRTAKALAGEKAPVRRAARKAGAEGAR